MKRRQILTAALAGLMLQACEAGPGFNTTSVAGAKYGPGLQLRDHNGQMRSLADFQGKAVVIFFGYTMCPDVCPTSLSTLKDALAQLGEDAARVQVLFISVDPARDTPERLALYMNAFRPDFLALTGSDAEIARVAKEFGAVYEKKGDVAGGYYTIDHTAGCYIFDPTGRPRLFARHGETASRIAADLRLLLAGQ